MKRFINIFEILGGLQHLMSSVFALLCFQLLKCVLRELLEEEEEAQKNLLQVHLNGTVSAPFI